jgi:ABC-type branched-subunit amino acid transport system ATPase component/ABC-type branched-subunit amino acid transport system permease subunit
MTYVVFLLTGLGNGATYAALAVAVVMTFRSSGVLNFAAGATALYTAYTYAFLRQGELLNPVPGLPSTISLGIQLSFGLALAGSLLLAGVVGALLYLLVFRPLREAPAVTKAVASIGLLVFFQALLAERAGTTPVEATPVFPAQVFSVGGAQVPADRIWIAATVVAVTAALAICYRFTRFGLVTRAVAETEKGALVSGLSPQRVAMANWALSTMVAGLGGILIASIVPLTPVAYTLFIVPAMAASLVAGFSGLWTAVTAGLLIGMLQSELSYLQVRFAWLPQSGLAELVPLALVLGFMVVRGRPLPQRGAIVLKTLGRAPRPRRLLGPAVLGAAVGVIALTTTTGTWRDAVITSIIFALLGLSMVIVTGFAGQVSLAQVSLAGVAAFTLSRLGTGLGIPFPFAPLLAACAAAVVGVAFGLPALRIRGLPVAVVTLALAVALDAFWFNNPRYTGGFSTGAPVPQPSVPGLDLSVGSGITFPRISFGLLCLCLLVVTGLGVAWLRRSPLGGQMLAVRANERSAAASGIDVARVKIVAFAIGAFIAGLSGALLAYQQSFASEVTFSPVAGLGFFAVVYLCGVTSITGGVLAGAAAAGGVVYLVFNQAISLGSWYATLSGLGLVVTVIRNPEGVAGGLHMLGARLLRRPGLSAAAGQPGPAARREPGGPEPAVRRPRPGGEDQPLLTLRDISVRYGGVVAVEGVSLDIGAGQIVGLIGPNGAGKTSLVDAVCGFAPATGSIVFGGQHIERLRPHQRVRRGLGRTFQGIDLYDDLTVTENVQVGMGAGRLGRARRGAAGEPESVAELCSLLGLAGAADSVTRELSQGQRQLVSVGRALAGRPRLLVLDEPTGGLDTGESAWLAEQLARLPEIGATVLLITHDMGLLGICDQVHMLDVGRLTVSGTPAQIRTNAQVAAAYLGASAAAAEPDAQPRSAVAPAPSAISRPGGE